MPGSFRWVDSIVLAVFSLVFAECLADSWDTVNLNLTHSITYDDNLFRVPQGPRKFFGKTDRSDFLTTSAVGIAFKKPYSLQQIELSLDLIGNRYSNYSQLNFETTNFTGAWRWQLTPSLTGNIYAARYKSLQGFADFRTYDKIVQKAQEFQVDADWNIEGPWHVQTGTSESKTRNSQQLFQDLDNRSVMRFWGASHVWSSGSSVQLLSRRTDGRHASEILDFFSKADNGYRYAEDLLKFSWRITGKSTLSGFWGHGARTHEHFPVRNYSGPVSRLEWTWDPTGRLRISSAVSHGLANFWDTGINSSYYESDTVSLSPTLQVSGKTALTLVYSHGKRHFLGPVPGFPVSNLEDQTDILRLGLAWYPLRAVTVNGYLRREFRKANLVGREYEDNSMGVSVQASF